ncbi:MAG: O-antigen ligase family protein [Alphaproteobacteria bacterium]|nr:O-antigen ligase family protein [Alphaproteobacteria bacterium]MBU1512952.1 O-antigen ligase family protein [Alphaproteobacteria bacterium]MBU2094874.1 O-antigen ligase family protein [Alphaproteobacteria bacterium]MBU2152780.1 O-antigen ligase family protein [Alphaproteobacteria bacterium]MBU2306311.1 O-antigen ligase family protein [Alphaproteobacteria bacterium]
MQKLFKRRDAAAAEPLPAMEEYAGVPFYRRRRMNRWAKAAVYVGLGVLCVAYGFGFARFAPFLMLPFAIPIALLAILVVWALPSGDYAPTDALQPLFIMFFGSIFLWPSYLALALPGLPWITLLRLTGMPLLVVLLVCLSVSPQFRKNLRDIFTFDPWLFRIVMGFLILQAVSMLYSVNPGTAANRYIVYTTNWTSIFFVSLVLFSRAGFALRWMHLLMAGAAMICLLGVWESRALHVLWAAHIPSILKIEDESVLRTLSGTARAATGKYRVLVTYSTPLGLSEFLGLVAPFAAHMLLTSKKNAPKIFAGVYMLVAFYVVLETDSRLGLISSILSLLLYMLFWALLQWRRSKGSIIAPAIVLAYPAIFFVGVASTFFIGRLRAKVWGNGSQSASDQSRVDQWNLAIPKMFSHPQGHGVGQAGSVLNYIGSDGVPTIDSYFINMLLDYGFIGFALYFGMFARGAWIGARSIVRGDLDRELQLLLPLSICLINYIIIKSVFSQDDNHPMVFMMLGAVVALSRRADIAAKLAGTSTFASRQLSRSARFQQPRLQPAASGLRRESGPGRN